MGWFTHLAAGVQLDCHFIALGRLDLGSEEAFLLVWCPASLLHIERLGLLRHELLAVDSKVLEVGIGGPVHGRHGYRRVLERSTKKNTDKLSG